MGFIKLNKRFHHDDMKVTYLDVGQGTSALVELPGGECMLIDGGGFSDNEMFDVGEKIVAPYLWSKRSAMQGQGCTFTLRKRPFKRSFIHSGTFHCA